VWSSQQNDELWIWKARANRKSEMTSCLRLMGFPNWTTRDPKQKSAGRRKETTPIFPEWSDQECHKELTTSGADFLGCSSCSHHLVPRIQVRPISTVSKAYPNQQTNTTNIRSNYNMMTELLKMLLSILWKVSY
jgi:hypothetical protein